jgi:hypothetical protein
MVSVSISTVVMAVLATLLVYQARSSAGMVNYMDLDRYSRTAVDLMSKDLRQANRVLTCNSTNLSCEMVDATTGATNTLKYIYNPGEQTLVRQYKGLSYLLLKGITPNSLQFSMFQRNPIGGTVDQYATTNVNLCKVIQYSWQCSRSLLGQSNFTESVQCAKVVIRKE